MTDLTAKPRNARERKMAELDSETCVENVGFQAKLDDWKFRVMKRYLTPPVLDIGCGAGFTIKRMIGAGVAANQIVGIDGSSRKLGLARAQLPADVRLVHTLIGDFDIDSLRGIGWHQPFRTALLTNVLEHLTYEEAEQCLNDTWCCLCGEGKVLIVVPNETAIHKQVGRIMGLGTYTKADREVGHKSKWDTALLETVLFDTGYGAVTVEGIFLKPLPNSEMEKWPDELCEAYFEWTRQHQEIKHLCSSLFAKGEVE